MNRSILITGSSGFVGGYVERYFKSKAFKVRSAVRKSRLNCEGDFLIKNIDSNTDWSNALVGVDCVIHCAAIAHDLLDRAIHQSDYKTVNVDGTLALAQQAALSGVKRFIFISSIKVNGEVTLRDNFFTADDIPSPIGFYASSKFEAERGLWKISKNYNMEVVVIRPPLIYGDGVKGNLNIFSKMVKSIKFIPLGCANKNLRSFVYIENLVDFIEICVNHPNAANQPFLVSDGHDLSTTELINLIASSLGKKIKLISVPAPIIYFLLGFLISRASARKLFESLRVNIDKNYKLLGWRPKVSIGDAFEKVFWGGK